MKTGFKGTFVISWTQTELDGQKAPSVSDLEPGRTWAWTGEAVRVDGPSGLLPLGDPKGEADLRKRAALTVRRLLGASQNAPAQLALQDPLFEKHFDVTDGRSVWSVSVIPGGAGRKPLLMFHEDIPPRQCELWVVRHNLDAPLRAQADENPGGVICFTPGTMIKTADGPRDVAALREGDWVQTKDNGLAEILWLGQRYVSGARLMALPALTPVRLRAGSLDKEVPDAGLLVSPDHRMVLKGARALALFNQDEVLVTARDLVNDHSIIRDHAVKSVTYIHMLLPQHEIVFANDVATESFHPASAALATMQANDKARLFDRMPEIRNTPDAYGDYARRVLDKSETAILRHDAVGFR